MFVLLSYLIDIKYFSFKKYYEINLCTSVNLYTNKKKNKKIKKIQREFN